MQRWSLFDHWLHLSEFTSSIVIVGLIYLIIDMRTKKEGQKNPQCLSVGVKSWELRLLTDLVFSGRPGMIVTALGPE